MSERLVFERLAPSDLFAIEVQASQRMQHGIPVSDLSIDEANSLAEGESWTAWDGERIIACFGITETFPGAQGVAWALLADGIGSRHLQLTRFARQKVIDPSSLNRIEAIVRCGNVDRSLTRTRQVLDAIRHPTPEIRWMLALGFEPAIVLHRFGAADETHMLMERIAQ